MAAHIQQKMLQTIRQKSYQSRWSKHNYVTPFTQQRSLFSFICCICLSEADQTTLQPPLIPMTANGRTTQQNAAQETKICLLCSLKEQQSKKKVPLLCTSIMTVNPVGWTSQSSAGVAFCVTVEGHVHVSRGMRLSVCESCVTRGKKETHNSFGGWRKKTTVDVLLPGMQWHRSPAPSARPEYRKCPVRRCRPEPRYL